MTALVALVVAGFGVCHATESVAVASVAVDESLDPAMAERYERVSFSEVLVMPAGPKGLEFTERIKALDGELVRMRGFMVRELNADPGLFLFAAAPVTTYACESLPAGDLPPNVVQVMLASRPGFGAAWRAESLTVFGRLELGGREERDGRISYVRLHAEHISAGETLRLVDVQIPLARRALGDRSQR